MMTETTHAYVGIDVCGCLRAAVIDSPDHKAEVRRQFSGFIRWGIVDLWPIEAVRIGLCLESHKPVCPHPGKCPSREKALPMGAR